MPRQRACKAAGQPAIAAETSANRTLYSREAAACLITASSAPTRLLTLVTARSDTPFPEFAARGRMGNPRETERDSYFRPLPPPAHVRPDRILRARFLSSPLAGATFRGDSDSCERARRPGDGGGCPGWNKGGGFAMMPPGRLNPLEPPTQLLIRRAPFLHCRERGLEVLWPRASKVRMTCPNEPADTSRSFVFDR